MVIMMKWVISSRSMVLMMKWVILLSMLIACKQVMGEAMKGVDCLKQTCGNLKVSYPFTLKSEAECPSYSSFFELECKGGELYLNNMTRNDEEVQVRVVALQRDSLIIDASGLRAVMQPMENGSCSTRAFSHLSLNFSGPFVFADDNLFVSFGCTLGVVYAAALQNDSFFSTVKLGGCSVFCPGNEMNPVCGGHPCCFSNLPHGRAFREVAYEVRSNFLDDNNEIFNSTPCHTNYATLFDCNYTDFAKQSYGLKLKWALPFYYNQTNPTMDIQNSPNFSCSAHSNITIVQGVPGYLCSCQHGFDGDGYSLGFGCSDVDECANISSNDCIHGKSTCQNDVEGSYSCKCNSRYHVGDGLRKGSGCNFSPTFRNLFLIICGILFFGLLIGGFLSFSIYWRRKIKRMYFVLNGGMELEYIISQVGGNQEIESRLFTLEELKAATNNYADDMKLGIGGFGTVYKGVLANGRLVAIKKSNKVGKGGTSLFVNEMKILMQINHRNIVRLLGCCMESAVPLLVYEFVSHGNVRENLDIGDPGFMNWVQRLKVACQTAEALAYLHAAASPPILHRDVKSTNILLDDNLNAKVADFGASRLVPNGIQHVSTAVQGTIGYLDPEYFQTFQLTDKSDVYSLGVMLVELITGLKPIDSQSFDTDSTSLALLFIKRMQEARGEELIDSRLKDVFTLESAKPRRISMVQSSIMVVASLAWQCLSLHGVDRPSMSFLADELRHINRSLEDFDNELDANEESLVPHKPNISKLHQAGAVLKQDDNFFVQSSSSNMPINDLDIPTMQ